MKAKGQRRWHSARQPLYLAPFGQALRRKEQARLRHTGGVVNPTIGYTLPKMALHAFLSLVGVSEGPFYSRTKRVLGERVGR